ncbi:MAG: T9SS type A sorting domain-containing protein [Bacteroidetes bacterium]|nr:T9SS type A sorting domain-containing protein [Bacteroidota bacterium]
MHKKDSFVCYVSAQSNSTVTPWLNYGYSPTYKYIVPSGLKTGIYNVGGKINLVIKNKLKNADITILYPSNTEAAYNNAGDKSLYAFNSIGNIKETEVGFLRPLSPFIINEVKHHCYPFLKWLLPLSNQFSVQYIQDGDLDDYSEIAISKILVVIGHSEYWTRNARINFDKFIANGNHGVIFSGNTMGWQVRYDVNNTKLICYKNAALDPETNPLLKTILWTNPTLSFPVLNSIGVDWFLGAYGMHPYHGNYGYKIVEHNSPLLQGTGLAFHSQLDCQSYEYDAATVLGYDNNGDVKIDTVNAGFCKIELIGWDYGNSTSATPYVPVGFGTFIVAKKSANSGVIVNSAFNTFTGKTPSYGKGGFGGKDSLKIKIIILNTFNKLLNNQNVFAHPNNCTPSVAGLNNYTNINDGLINLYPNPNRGLIYIENFTNVLLDFNIFDLTGKIIYSGKVAEERAHFNLENLQKGIYIYTIQNTYKTVIKKGKLIIE